MSLANIKTKSQGFTIVELLIVVVVIAILAAITIISYAGITARANESAIKLQASNFQKKAEAYNAEKGNYPVAVGDLSGSSNSYYFSDSNVTNTTATPATASPDTLTNDSSVTKRLRVRDCGGTTATTIKGLEIYYFNPNGSKVESVTVGTGC